MAQHFLCRCEEITADEICRAIGSGARTVNDVKRQTRAGMGVCQGIYCVAEIAKSLTARPPVRVTPVARLRDAD